MSTKSEEAAAQVTLEDSETYSTVRIRATDGGRTLMALTGVFSKYDVSVLEASISTDDGGRIVDVFRIATPQAKPVRAPPARPRAAAHNVGPITLAPPECCAPKLLPQWESL